MAAKFKKTAKKTTGKTQSAGKGSAQEQAERLSKTLSESAQQIWLAGVGAFGRAQAEGTKLFEGLVKEGLSLEQTARKFTGGQANVLRDAVESKVGQARERATDTWDRLEKVFEERVQRALVKLGVPGRDDLAGLSDRVDALTAELRRQGGAPPTRKAGKAVKGVKATKPAAAARKPKAAKAPAKAAKAARKSIARPKPPVAP
ncbi:MAG: phasin family protein [Lysobacter sp.]